MFEPLTQEVRHLVRKRKMLSLCWCFQEPSQKGRWWHRLGFSVSQVSLPIQSYRYIYALPANQSLKFPCMISTLPSPCPVARTMCHRGMCLATQKQHPAHSFACRSTG